MCGGEPDALSEDCQFQ